MKPPSVSPLYFLAGAALALSILWLWRVRHRNRNRKSSLFGALRSPNPRQQMAAAAILMEELRRDTAKGSKAKENSELVQTIISATNFSETYNVELGKFIADNIVDIIGATGPAARSLPARSQSSSFDWRNVRVSRAYWPCLDARRANFSEANLASAVLKGAFLEAAVFKNANLRQCKMQNADIRFANFEEADLRGANLKGANAQGAIFTNAKYDSATCFPDNVDPVSAKMIDAS